MVRSAIEEAGSDPWGHGGHFERLRGSYGTGWPMAGFSGPKGAGTVGRLAPKEPFYFGLISTVLVVAVHTFTGHFLGLGDVVIGHQTCPLISPLTSFIVSISGSYVVPHVSHDIVL